MSTFLWILACVVLVLIELITPTALVTIWFGVGCVVGAILCYFEFNIWVQLFSFLFVSILCILVIRPLATKYLRGNLIATNADRCIGEIGLVVSDISAQSWGQVKVNGTLWHAVSVNHKLIEANKEVKIMAIEGVKLIVKEIES